MYLIEMRRVVYLIGAAGRVSDRDAAGLVYLIGCGGSGVSDRVRGVRVSER